MASVASVATNPPATKAIGRVVAELARTMPVVDAAFVYARRHDVWVVLVARDHSNALGEAIVDVEDAFAERFPGAEIEVKARAHQGRGASPQMVPDGELVYTRKV